MIEADLSYRVRDLADKVDALESTIEVIKACSIEDDMWDNSDMMRNWKISQRTLASWRANGSIEYVQFGGKIWYTKENRNAFLLRNTVKAKSLEFSTFSN